MTNPNDVSTPLEMIIGEQLSAVSFVQDYVELHFDGPRLSAFTHPAVRVQDKLLKWGDPAYRDVLCGRITKVVSKVVVVEGEAISIEFNDGSVISVSLNYGDYADGQAEAARFVDDVCNTQQWEVWN